MKSLEVTLILIFNSWRRRVGWIQERLISARHSQRHYLRRASCCRRSHERCLKTWLRQCKILRRASRCGFQERFIKPGFCQCQSYGPRRVAVFKNVLESLVMPVPNPMARVASWLSPLAYWGTNFEIWNFALHFCCHLKDLLFLWISIKVFHY